MSAHEDGVRAVAEALLGEEAAYCGPGYGTCGSVSVGKEQAEDLARVALVASLRWMAGQLNAPEHATGSRDFGRGYMHGLTGLHRLADEIEAS